MRTTFVLLPLLVALAGCGRDAPEDEHARDDHGHAADARYGGFMVEVGHHFAWIELVHDAEAGRLTAYVWDAHVEHALRLDRSWITVKLLKDMHDVALKLTAKADPLTGDTAERSSRFEVTDAALQGASRLEGEIGPVEIKGEAFPSIPFAIGGSGGGGGGSGSER